MIKTIERSDHIRRRFGIAHMGMLACDFSTDFEANPHVCFIRAEGGEEKPEPGKEPTGKCEHCQMQNEADAKFCDQCGKSMAAPKAEKEPDGDDAPPPSSKPKPAAAAPEKMSPDATLAAILGATGESPLALKTAAIGLRHVRDTAAGITGKSSPGSIVGALLAVPEQIERGNRAAADLAAQTRAADKSKRWALAHRLNALGLAGRTRATIFEDEVSASGDRKTIRLQPEYARMDLDVFESLVTGLEKNAPKTKATPFEASRAKAEAAAQAAPGGSAPVAFSDDEKKRLEGHDAVKLLRARGSALEPAQLVAGLIASNPQGARAFLQNGAQS